MKIDEILDLMDQLLDHAKPIPFASHKVIVDGDRLRELINDMRMNKPEEIRRAKLIEFDCDRIIQEAQTNALCRKPNSVQKNWWNNRPLPWKHGNGQWKC